MDNIYNVNKYTDEQLYEILDMNNPTDRELEAKIIQMINKYEHIPSEIGKQLYTFFDNIYKRFFSTDSDDEVEGFTDKPTTTPQTTTQTTSQTTTTTSPTTQNIASVQQFDYSADKLQLNPLLKQTIKRVISIDSQYRNISTYPSTTNFSFDLSEPLRDVVSLKLYSIQIPYTWYTVAKSYGSNFFYLTGNSPGITDVKYKIMIEPGNYDQITLPEAINKAFQDLSNNTKDGASDVNFNGLPLITYNSVTAKTTIQLNLQNTFNETYYNIRFPFYNYPSDISRNQTNSIAGFLGFNQQEYYINSITSKQNLIKTSIITTQLSQDYILDNSNNYFTVIQYIPYTPFSHYDSNSTILNTQKVQLTNNGLPYTAAATRQNIIDSLNQTIISSGYFDSSSKIQRIDITNSSNINYNYSYFQLYLTLNRNIFKYIPNSKIVVVFPNESYRENQYGESFSIWRYQPNTIYSCFFFESTTNEFSQLTSESPAIQSTIAVDASTNIIMKCTTPGFSYSSINDFSMNIQQGTYNINGFLNAINTSFSNKNTTTTTYFNMTNTQALLDGDDYFNLNVDVTKSFQNQNYNVRIDGNSFLTTTPNISYQIVNKPNKTNSTILSDISYINITIPKLYGGYSLSTPTMMIIQPDISYGDAGNRDISSVNVNIASSTPTTYQSFLSSIENSFTTTTVTTSLNTQTPLIKTIFKYKENENTVDISLNLNYYYYLTEADYDLYFEDYNYDISSSQNIWNKFNVDISYDLYTDTNSGIASIKANAPVSPNIISSLTIYDNCNNTITFLTSNPNIPQEEIVISIPSGTYTTGQLITAINNALSTTSKTYGTHFQIITINNDPYTTIRFNINKIYTTSDYVLEFYNPVNFVSCYVGSSSVQNTTWDTTIGWILGFRDYTQYILTKENQTTSTSNTGNPYYYKQSQSSSYIIDKIIDPSSNILTSTTVKLTGDTSLSTNLYNYFMISLDDYIQNHLNDGLVTITRSQTSIEIPDYTYSSTQTCDPATNELVTTLTPQIDSNNVTTAQLYSLNQSVVSQQNTTKEYSPGPFIKDLFGIIPIKPPSKTGDYYTEFGGTLQNQERLYFGPVNIRKMSIQLLTDRGTIIDLNNSNWSFSFICEQLYRATSA